MKTLVGLFFFLLYSVTTTCQIPKSELAFKAHFTAQRDSLDQIEGIWNVSSVQEFYRYDTLYDVQEYAKATKIAILKQNGKFESYNLSGESYLVQFSRTDVQGVYLYRSFLPETQQYSKAKALISKAGEMEYSYDFPEEYLKERFKDSYEEGTRVANTVKWNRIFPESTNR